MILKSRSVASFERQFRRNKSRRVMMNAHFAAIDKLALLAFSILYDTMTVCFSLLSLFEVSLYSLFLPLYIFDVLNIVCLSILQTTTFENCLANVLCTTKKYIHHIPLQFFRNNGNSWSRKRDLTTTTTFQIYTIFKDQIIPCIKMSMR